MLDVIRTSLAASFDRRVVDELLEAYEEAKRRYYTGDLRPSAVEGGRFCEAAFRLLEQAVLGQFTPLGPKFSSVDQLLARLSTQRGQSPTLTQQWQKDSVGLHIPRALRIIYDIRNN